VYRRLLRLLSGGGKKVLTYSETVCHVVTMQSIDRGFVIWEIPECTGHTFIPLLYIFSEFIISITSTHKVYTLTCDKVSICVYIRHATRSL